MKLRVIGAGLGRTGTHSLKLALERLLDGSCYHMLEVFGHPEHVPLWQQASEGSPVDWDAIFENFNAAVDWPASAFWADLAKMYPDAVILLSSRDSEGWWKSASNTIFQAMDRQAPPEMAEWHKMVVTLLGERFTPGWRDEAAAVAAYERHNAEVRAN